MGIDFQSPNMAHWLIFLFVVPYVKEADNIPIHSTNVRKTKDLKLFKNEMHNIRGLVSSFVFMDMKHRPICCVEKELKIKLLKNILVG
jgi:hypothetical protein